jgi:hypothetical protein
MHDPNRWCGWQCRVQPTVEPLAGLLLQAWMVDKNSLLGEVNIQKRELCVKGIQPKSAILSAILLLTQMEDFDTLASSSFSP